MTDTTATQPSLGVQLLASLARHALTSLATILVGAGAITSDQQGQFVGIGTGVLLWAGAMLWSFIQKKRAAK